MSDVKRVTVSSRRPLRSGEWACVDAKCAHINAEKRVSCEICGKSKPRSKNRVGREIGKDAADKSKGLFSADDWVCTKCGNVNWARRSVCNVCNAPKLADLEVRTGYGGGYMDRQDVEYIEREDNEEFDEFGRKKKRQSKDAIEKNASALKEDDAHADDTKREICDDEKQSDNAKNDEEDEDSDDGDLDKYDLSADPELVSIKLDPTKLGAKSMADDKENDSDASSDCSCSCSGGECSCEESDDKAFVKNLKLDDDKKRSSARQDRDGRSERRDGADDRYRGRIPSGDRWRDCPRVRSREHSREREHHHSRDRERDRERDRHRDRDYRR